MITSPQQRMLSQRALHAAPSPTLAITAKANALKAQGKDVISFGAGEPDFDTPQNVKDAAVAALAKGDTKYTPSSGTVALKDAILAKLKRDNGLTYSRNEIIVSCGAKHSIYNLMQALLDPSDEVIIPAPYWVSYPEQVKLADGTPVIVQTNEGTGFLATASQIEGCVTSRTKLVIINSPSNPSGGVLTESEFRKIFELTSKREIYLMTDECYCQFLYEAKPFSIAALPGAKETVVVAGSLSKTYAMTGWRVGFALAPAPIIGAMMKLQSHSTSNPTSIAQKAAVEAMRGPQDSIPEMLSEYRNRRDFVINRLRAIPGVSIVVPKGAFYAYPNVSVAYRSGRVKNSMDFSTALLQESHVAVVPGEAFGTDDHVRISYATSMHELERGLDRIQKFIDGLR